MDIRAKGENLSTLLKCMLQQQRRLIVVVYLLLLVMTFLEWEGVAIGANLIITPYIACKERGIYSQSPGGGWSIKMERQNWSPTRQRWTDQGRNSGKQHK